MEYESLNFKVFLTDISGSSYMIKMLNFNSTQPMVRMICKQPGFLTVQLFSAKTISSRIAFSLEFWNVSTKHHSNDVGRSRQPLIIFKRRSYGTALPRRYTYCSFEKMLQIQILVWHEKACQVFRKEKRDPNVAFLCHAIISSKAQKIPHERELFS